MGTGHGVRARCLYPGTVLKYLTIASGSSGYKAESGLRDCSGGKQARCEGFEAEVGGEDDDALRPAVAEQALALSW